MRSNRYVAAALLASFAFTFQPSAAIAEDDEVATDGHQMTGWYIGAGTGFGSYDDFHGNSGGEEWGFKLTGAYWPSDYFGMEASYLKVQTPPGLFDGQAQGQSSDEDFSEIDGLQLALATSYPLGHGLRVIGKGGIFFSTPDEKSEADLTYGAGLGYHVHPRVVLRAEWERLDMDATIDNVLFSVFFLLR